MMTWTTGLVNVLVIEIDLRKVKWFGETMGCVLLTLSKIYMVNSRGGIQQAAGHVNMT